MTDINPEPPFDERVVLEELERLHRAIRASREQREQAIAEFESFVRTFRETDTPVAAATSPPSIQQAPATPARQLVAVSTVPSVQTSDDDAVTAGSTAGGPTEAAPTPDDVAPMATAAGHVTDLQVDHVKPVVPDARRRRGVLGYVAVGAVTVVALVLVLGRSVRGPSVEPSSSPPTPETRAAPAPAPTSTVRSAPPDTKPEHAVRISLTTLRPVWVRVMVDDRRTIERVLESGEQIPIEGDRVISVRAGDGGGVRVSINGRDAGLMGQDGQPITRKFEPIAR